MYAIIESGGKQYRVKQGDILQVELLAAEAGTVVQAEKVLAVGEGEGFAGGQSHCGRRQR